MLIYEEFGMPAKRNAKTHKNMNGDDRKKQILQIACRQFAEKSYDTVSVRELAAACSCSPSLIMKLYGSKENIYQALLTDLEVLCNQPIVIEIPEGPALEVIRNLYNIMDVSDSIDLLPSNYRVMLLRAISSRQSHIEEYHRIMLKQQDVERTVFLPLVEQGMEEGSIKRGDPAVVAHIIVCLIYGSAYLHQGFPALKKSTFEEIEKYVF
jgi:AcrR family transcriptional regulator